MSLSVVISDLNEYIVNECVNVCTCMCSVQMMVLSVARFLYSNGTSCCYCCYNTIIMQFDRLVVTVTSRVTVTPGAVRQCLYFDPSLTGCCR